MAECKCKESVLVESQKGVFVFSFPDEYLKTTLLEALQKGDFKSEEMSGVLMVEAECAKDDLHKIVKDANLGSFEIENINLAFVGSKSEVDFSILSKTRSLKTWLSRFDSEDIAQIIEDKALTTYFQPIVDVKSKSIYGYEALSRGVDSKGGIIPPNIIFGKAREGDYMFQLDRLAREISLKTAAVKNIHGYVFINFIPTSIYNPKNCLQNTLAWAKQLEMDFSKIVFEVVETEKVEDIEHLKTILEFYKENGFKVALDDVGSGYSNLNMLAHLNPDIIKIDRELIQDIDKNELKQSIFFALKHICDKNGIIKLAEGVESKEEVEFLKPHVDLMQGYYFAKPASEVVRDLRIEI
jgi:EAL domain-containing protein (putative c-di-GMP-specific phosphodiesterase class I)